MRGSTKCCEMPCFVFVLFVFSRAVRHQVLKGTRFVCLFVCLFVFSFTDFALWTLIDSRPDDTFFVVPRTVLEQDWHSSL